MESLLLFGKPNEAKMGCRNVTPVGAVQCISRHQRFMKAVECKQDRAYLLVQDTHYPHRTRGAYVGDGTLWYSRNVAKWYSRNITISERHEERQTYTVMLCLQELWRARQATPTTIPNVGLDGKSLPSAADMPRIAVGFAPPNGLPRSATRVPINTGFRRSYKAGCPFRHAP